MPDNFASLRESVANDRATLARGGEIHTADNGMLPLAEGGGQFLNQQTTADGRAFFADPNTKPNSPHMESDSGSPAPRPKAKGIGGTTINPYASMSPAHLLIMADEMEQDLISKTRAAENPYGSSLEGSIDRGNSLGGEPSTVQDVPDWLNEYMSHQPFTDPYHQVPGPGHLTLDAIKQNKYLSEQEKLKYMRSLRK